MPTPMSPMMIYLKMNSYGNDIAAASLWWLTFLCCGGEKKKRTNKKKERVSKEKKESNHSLKKKDEQRKKRQRKKKRKTPNITKQDTHTDTRRCGDDQNRAGVQGRKRVCLFVKEQERETERDGKEAQNVKKD